MKTFTHFGSLILVVAIATVPQLVHAYAARILTGSDAGPGGPHVTAFTGRTQTNVASFLAYPAAFNGGVRVASGDVNGDGAADIITGTGAGAAHVKVFSGNGLGELRSFLPYGSGFSGGIFVAAGDVNGDGLADIVTGTDAGASGGHVKVFDGVTGAELHSFFVFPGFTGGVRVAAGDINGDGLADIITGSGPGASPHVKVFDGRNLAELRSFFAYTPSFTGGVHVAVGDLTGGGRADIITGADAGAGPHVKVFNGATLAELQSFFPFSPQFQGGVRVGAADLDGDGRDEILAARGGGATPQVVVLDGLTVKETASFFAYPAASTNGVFVAAASLKHPWLRSSFNAAQRGILLTWPSGCPCALEANPEVADPRGWLALDIRPIQNSNRFELLLPAIQKAQFFRLNCGDE